MSYRMLSTCALALLVCIAGVSLAEGRSDVADAVMRGDTAAVRTLLQQKADVNAPQIDGATALHWAGAYERLPCTLLQQKADVNAPQIDGATALHIGFLLQ